MKRLAPVVVTVFVLGTLPGCGEAILIGAAVGAATRPDMSPENAALAGATAGLCVELLCALRKPPPLYWETHFFFVPTEDAAEIRARRERAREEWIASPECEAEGARKSGVFVRGGICGVPYLTEVGPFVEVGHRWLAKSRDDKGFEVFAGTIPQVSENHYHCGASVLFPNRLGVRVYKTELGLVFAYDAQPPLFINAGVNFGGPTVETSCGLLFPILPYLPIPVFWGRLGWTF